MKKLVLLAFLVGCGEAAGPVAPPEPGPDIEVDQSALSCRLVDDGCTCAMPSWDMEMFQKMLDRCSVLRGVKTNLY